MPLLGKSTLTTDIEPEGIGLVNADGKELKGMFASLRLLPKAVSEKLIRPVQRKLRKKDDDESEEALARWMREHVAKALADTRGVEWSFLDQASVDAYSKFLPGVKAGVPVSLDGRWSDEFKARFLDDHPAVVAIFLDAYRRLATLGAEEEREEEAKKD